MKKSRFSEEEKIAILKEVQARATVVATCAKHSIGVQTYHGWKRKFGGMEVDEAWRLRALEEENGRLKRVGGGFDCAGADPKRGERKKMVSPSSRRRAVKSVVEEGLGSAVQACRAINLGALELLSAVRSTARRVDACTRRWCNLSQKHPRYGYRRITALLRRSGLTVNAKRVQRLRRLGPGQNERLHATKPRQVWSWDFVGDQTENGPASVS